MNNLTKISTLNLVLTTLISTNLSMAMERDNITRFERPQLIKLAESTERHPKDEFSKPALERMLIDEDLVRDVSDKARTVNYVFKSLGFNPLQDICWTIAKFYYQLHMNEKFQNVNYIINNKDLINAIDNNKKYNVMYMDNCFVNSHPGYVKAEELPQKLQNGNTVLGEIFLLKKSNWSLRGRYPDFLDGIKLILDKCSVQTIKADSSLFESSNIAKYFSDYYSNSLVSKIGEDEGEGDIFLPYIRKPDLHLYLDFNQTQFSSLGHDVYISSIVSRNIFSYNLMNSGSFNITCINTQKPYDRRVFSTEQHQSQFQEQQSALTQSLGLEGALGVIGTIVSSVYGLFGTGKK